MKIIFLDIDGVLNSEQFYDKYANGGERPDHPDDDFDPDAIELLFNYIEKHDLHLVITSWRESTLKQTLCFFGETRMGKLCPRIIGQTCRRFDGMRGKEIDMWLENRPEIDEFVIIDDDNFDIHQKDHLVQTDPMYGLTKEDLEKCSKILRIYK